jgi:ribonuclease E
VTGVQTCALPIYITVAADDTLTGANYHALERGELASGPRVSTAPAPLRVDSLRAEPIEDDIVEEDIIAEEETFAEPEARAAEVHREVREGREREPRRFNGEEGEEGGPRGRRRRRRRGRGGGQNGEVFAPGAEQPSDEGLAIVAEIEGQPAPREGREPREPRRGRGPGRWRRSAPLPEEFRDPSELFPIDGGAQDAVGFLSPREAHMPEFPAEPVSAAPQETVAETPVERPVEIPAEPAPPPAVESRAVEPAPEPAPPAAPRKSTEVVITSADPAAPKKGGWWQRMRQPFGE